MEIAEFSAALEIGINPFAYRGGVMPPADFLESMGWALDNCGVMVGEADRRGLDEWTWKQQRYRLLLKHLGPFWDSNAVARAFRKAEAEAGFPTPSIPAYPDAN